MRPLDRMRPNRVVRLRIELDEIDRNDDQLVIIARKVLQCFWLLDSFTAPELDLSIKIKAEEIAERAIKELRREGFLSDAKAQ